MRFYRGWAGVMLVISLMAVAELNAQHDSPYLGDAEMYGGLRGGFIQVEDVDEDGSFNVGIFWGWFLSNHFTLEASFDFQFSEILIGEGPIFVNIDLLERETLALQVGGTFTPLPAAPVRPYLLGGLGYYRSQYTYDEPRFFDDEVDDGGTYLGLGFDVSQSPLRDFGFSLNIEVRWLFTQAEEIEGQTFSADGFTANLGFRYRF